MATPKQKRAIWEAVLGFLLAIAGALIGDGANINMLN